MSIVSVLPKGKNVHYHQIKITCHHTTASEAAQQHGVRQQA